MASITDEIYNIKCALKDVLMQMGGEAAINDFGKKYIKIYGKINLKKYGAKSFFKFVQKFPDLFKIIYCNGICQVSIIESRPTIMTQFENICVTKTDVMNRFLADCYESLPKDRLNFESHKNNSSLSEKDSNFSAILGLTLDEVKENFGILNPFLEDIVREFFNEASLLLIISEIHRKNTANGDEISGANHPLLPIDSISEAYEDSLVDMEEWKYDLLDKIDEDTHPIAYENCAALDVNSFDKEFDELEAIRESRINIAVPQEETHFDDSFESLESLSEHQKKSFVKFDVKSISSVGQSVHNEVEKTPIITLPFDDMLFYMHYPSHLRDVNFKLPEKPKLTKEIVFNKTIMCSESHSPLNFWFFTRATFDQCIELNRKFKEEYGKLIDAEALRVAPENLKKGLLVYAYHEGLKGGFRARIIRVEGEYVFVFYIDYGTADATHMKNIKYLMNEYLNYPELCYRGRVYGVQPYDDIGFSLFHQTFFVDTVGGDIEFKTELKFYDAELDTYELKLRFRHSSRDLAELLIREKICKPIPVDILKDRDILLVQPVYYLNPTHESLESGRCENYEKMLAYQDVGIDMNILANTNYFMNRCEVTNAVEDMLKLDYLKEVRETFSTKKYRDN